MSSIIEDDKYIICNEKKDITKVYKTIKTSKYGSNSDIYKYNNQELLKVFYKPHSIEEMNDLERMSNIRTKALAIAKKILFISEQFYGFSMDEKSGIALFSLKLDTLLNDFLKSLKDIEKDLTVLGNNHYIAVDLNVFNILYDCNKKESNLIDCDGLFYNKSLSKDSCTSFNLRNLYLFVLRFLSDVYDIRRTKSKCLLYMNDIVERKFEYSASIDKLFGYLIDFLEEYTDKEINSIGDFRKSLKLSNKISIF